ncbi:FtsX-like permease family protein [Promethearchaeum syntrophicum]|uniref:FtsX-like permease family protein n=1 Tax=Promethearchaeum syntrophicum TaxID=2594042 RepID=A0A5B9DFB9_9ARCH
MRPTIKYTISQALKVFKRSPLLIISLGVTLSLVTGMNIYIYNAKVYQLENFKGSFFDISILENNENENFPLNGTEFFESNYAYFASEVEKTFLIKQTSPIFQLSNDYVILESTEIKSTDNHTDHLEWLYSDTNFYESKDFSRDYTLYSGRLPQNETEYLIDIVSAAKMGLIPGQINHAQLSIKEDLNVSGTLRSYSLSNPLMIVVGVVIPNNDYCELLSYWTKIEMSYSVEEVENMEMALREDWWTGVVMGVIDIENLHDHPMLKELDTASILFNQTNWEIYAGVGFSYDRSTIDPNHISQIVNDLGNKRAEFYNDLPRENIDIYFEIIYNLESIQSGSQEFFILQILTVPLFFCIIFISQLLVKTAFYPRFNEIHLSLMKGYPRNMILAQILVEIFLMGISVGLLSLGFSRVLYGGIQTILNPSLNRVSSSSSISWSGSYARLVAPTSPLPFNITPSLILWACIIGLVTTLVIYFQLMIRIKNLKLHSLTDYLEQRDLESSLDENVLLKKMKKNNNKAKSRSDASNKMKDDNTQQYKSQEFYYSRNLRKFGWIFVLIGGIPLLFTIIMQVGSQSTFDILVFLSQTLFTYAGTLAVLNFFSPILLIFGVLRILLFEHPIWYSKLCKAFSTIFIGEKSIINALETFRHRHLKSISIFMALITGLFIFTNLSIYSGQNLEPTIYNAKIGTDLNIHTINNYDAMATSINEIPSQDLLELTQNFENISIEGEDEFKAKACPIVSLCDISQTNWDYKSVVLTNLSQYLVMAQQPIVKSLFPKLEKKLIELEAFNEENPNVVGILAAQSFLDTFGYSIGESFIINPQLFPFTGNFSQKEPMEVKIINKIACFPGYYHTLHHSHPILMDIGEIWEENIMITYDTLNFMVGFSQDYEISTQIPLSKVYQDVPEQYQIQLIINRFDYSTETCGIFNFSGMKDENLSIFLLYIELILILLFVELSILFLVNLYQRTNEKYYGSLLVQGFGKKNIHLMVLAQILFVIGFSFLVGVILGTITGLSWTYSLLSVHLANQGLYSLSIPLTFNFPEFFVILITLIVGTLTSYFLIMLKYHGKEYAEFLKRDI